MVTQLSSAATSTTSGPYTAAPAQAAAAIMRFGGLGSNSERAQEKVIEEPLREEDGQLNVEVAERMLKWHAEAVGRCTELCSANDVYVRICFQGSTVADDDSVCSSKQTFALLRVLAAAIGSAYIGTAIETCVRGIIFLYNLRAHKFFRRLTASKHV